MPIPFFLGRDGQDAIAVVGGPVWSSGEELNAVDPATNSVVASSRTRPSPWPGQVELWTTDLTSTVTRIDL